jgi:NAD(P)-dependent dehydrogenase (short-subunit alcohol dehydrogenase family)
VGGIVVVTGAASGIGRATCSLLASEGWTAIGFDRDTPAKNEWVQVDLGDADALVAVLSDLERVDGLVNNAAVQHFKALGETSVAEWDAVSAQNLRAPFVAMKALWSRLAAAHGAVVNVCSVHAVATSASIAAYASSKGGLVALTRAAALEFAEAGVRVNAVLPGAIATPALHEGFRRRPDAEASLIARTPLRRIGTPEEVAEAIVFLLDGRRSSFVTGQTLVVDGGALAQLSTE